MIIEKEIEIEMERDMEKRNFMSKLNDAIEETKIYFNIQMQTEKSKETKEINETKEIKTPSKSLDSEINLNKLPVNNEMNKENKRVSIKDEFQRILLMDLDKKLLTDSQKNGNFLVNFQNKK